MKLKDIAHARTGDKGDTSNIAIIAFRAEDWPRLNASMTAERVAQHFGASDPSVVTRYDLPQLHALNFVIRGALSGGVTRSLARDAHGKCRGATLLEIELPTAHEGFSEVRSAQSQRAAEGFPTFRKHRHAWP